MLLALLLASDETIRVVGDRVRRQGLSGSTARLAAAEMIKSKLATQTIQRNQVRVDVMRRQHLQHGRRAGAPNLGRRGRRRAGLRAHRVDAFLPTHPHPE